MDSIVHFELPAKNIEETKKFYEDMFGWKMQSMPEMNYTMVYTSDVDENHMPKTPGAVNGGMMTVEDNGGLNPVLVIDVTDIDAYVQKLQNAGVEIVQPKAQVGDMGYYVRFKDPSGVVMGLWETIKAS